MLLLNSLGENENNLSQIWDQMKEEFKADWFTQFKEAHQKNTRDGPGYIR